MTNQKKVNIEGTVCVTLYNKNGDNSQMCYLQESNLGLELLLWLAVSTEPWVGCVCVCACMCVCTCVYIGCTMCRLNFFVQLSGEVALLLEMMLPLTVAAAGCVREQEDE